MSSSVFAGNRLVLENPGYINYKGIYVGSFKSYLDDGTFLTVPKLENDTSDLVQFQGDVKLVIKLPQPMLIKGIWWSAYNKDTTNGIMVYFSETLLIFFIFAMDSKLSQANLITK